MRKQAKPTSMKRFLALTLSVLLLFTMTGFTFGADDAREAHEHELECVCDHECDHRHENECACGCEEGGGGRGPGNHCGVQMVVWFHNLVHNESMPCQVHTVCTFTINYCKYIYFCERCGSTIQEFPFNYHNDVHSNGVKGNKPCPYG